MIDILKLLQPRPLIAVLRADDAHQFLAASEVLCTAGITCLEYTLTTRGALAALRAARDGLPDEVLLGVGTIRTLARRARALLDSIES